MDSNGLSVKQKEEALNFVLKAVPGFDSMDVQDALMNAKWDKNAAVEELRGRPSKPVKRAYTVTPTNRNGNRAPKKARRDSDDGFSDGEAQYHKNNVFDSEDSENDQDYSGEMSIHRKEVYDFFNNANIGELSSIKTCSLKKVEIIMENRPYRNWEELVAKCEEKPLSTDLLNHCQEYLDKRNSLKKLMKKCKTIKAKLEKAVADGAGISEQPSSLNEGLKLSDYQLVGLNWLAVMHQNGTNGILADEMGLGKTIQIIAFLAWLQETSQQLQTHLIVVPSSTLGNWENELAKWCPSLHVQTYYGSQEDRKFMRIRWAKEGFDNVDIILTTYHVVASSKEDKKMFRTTPFHYCIFDEAHMLKNMTTQRYTALLTINAPRRILLTGTPLQNNLLELMSLLCFVMPKLFQNKTEDLKVLFSKKQKVEDGDSGSNFEATQIDRAKEIMKPFFLRRLKKDVLDFLPKKTEVVEKIKMVPKQQQMYHALIRDYKSVDGSSDKLFGRGQSILMDMRKLANHPMLLRSYFTDAKLHEVAKALVQDSFYKNNNAKEIFEDIAPLSDLKVHQLGNKYLSIRGMVKVPNDIVLNSGKFKHLDKLLPEMRAGGHRVLIFSQFVMVLDLVEMYLNHRGYKFVRLDGSTAVGDRQILIEQYSDDEDIFIFLLSTKAGGLGINLTKADRAIIHDIDFNPYNDKQAEDRCHRIGQTKDVVIHKLISEGTIEEGMYAIAREKLQLEKDVTSGEMDNDEKHRCMVRLMKMSLNLNDKAAEALLSPSKNKSNDDDDDEFDNAAIEEVYIE